MLYQHFQGGRAFLWKMTNSSLGGGNIPGWKTDITESLRLENILPDPHLVPISGHWVSPPFLPWTPPGTGIPALSRGSAGWKSKELSCSGMQKHRGNNGKTGKGLPLIDSNSNKHISTTNTPGKWQEIIKRKANWVDGCDLNVSEMNITPYLCGQGCKIEKILS